jgi:transposase-like protein
MKQSTKEKLEVRERRIFSDTLKKSAVKDLVNKRVTLHQLAREHQVSTNTIYR